MSLILVRRAARGVRRDIERSRHLRAPSWVYLALFALAGPLYYMSVKSGVGGEFVRQVIFAAGAVAFVIALKWAYRSKAWFWLTMASIIALHIPLIWNAPWAPHWVPGPVVYGLVCIDLFVMLFIINVVQLFTNQNQSRDNLG